MAMLQLGFILMGIVHIVSACDAIALSCSPGYKQNGCSEFGCSWKCCNYCYPAKFSGGYWNTYFCINGGGYSCSRCNPGRYATIACTSSSDTGPCADCPPEYYCPGIAVSPYEEKYACTKCISVPVQECTPYSNRVCSANDGYWMNGTVLQRCSDCQPGTYMTSLCGIYDSVCLTCKANSYCNGGTITQCPDTSYSLPGAKTIADCIFGCEPGFFCANSIKKPCPNSTTSVANASSYTDCYCKQGYSGTVTGPSSSTCAPCPIGSFCPALTPSRLCTC